MLKDSRLFYLVLSITINVHMSKIGLLICDTVRSIEDILDYTKRYQIEGRLISNDFKKAFDSVSRDFLFRTLSDFHFGPSFIQWIHTFYNNISSSVLNNGFSTAPFDVQRGVRHGEIRYPPICSSLSWRFRLSVYAATKMSRVLWWMEKKLNWNFLQMIFCFFVKW